MLIPLHVGMTCDAAIALRTIAGSKFCTIGFSLQSVPRQVSPVVTQVADLMFVEATGHNVEGEIVV